MDAIALTMASLGEHDSRPNEAQYVSVPVVELDEEVFFVVRVMCEL